MKKIIVLAACLFMFSLPCQAAKSESKPKKLPNVVRVPKGIELSEDQNVAVTVLNQKWAPEFVECRKEASKVLNKDQKKKRAEAVKAARDSGKKGLEFKKAVEEAIGMTPEQVAEQDRLNKKMAKLNKVIRTELYALFTEEQLASLKKPKKK
jgi:hypothetical protein